MRGSTPTWRNIKMRKVQTEPLSWQRAILAGAALIFLSVLLWYALAGFIRRLRRPTAPRVAGRTGGWARLAAILAVLTSLLGLLSIGMLAAFPYLVYTGFLGWLDLPAVQRVPFIFLWRSPSPSPGCSR